MLKMQLLGAKEAQDWLRQAPQKFAAAIRRGLKAAAVAVQERVQLTIYAGHEEHLNQGGGHLRENITHAVHEGYAEVGTNVVYAPVHEFGATIRPVNAKYLSIPVGDLKGSPRDYDLTWKPSRHPGGILVDSGDVLQYVLVDEVTIPPRPFLGPAMRDSEPAVKLLMERELKRELT